MSDEKHTDAEDTDGAAAQKFGEAAIGGFQIVPDILLKSQAELRVTNVEMVVLLNILMHWWTPGQSPYPRPSTISKRIGASTRTTQRAISALEEKGILKREMEQGRIYLNPAPLVAKLNELVTHDTHYQYRKQKNQNSSDEVKGTASDLF